MLNILLVTPENRNIGNAFINRGAEILLSKAGITYRKIELLESSQMTIKYPSQVVSPQGLELLKQSACIFVLGGSCLSRYNTRLFDLLKTIDTPKILLGAGFYENLEEETKLYKNIFSIFKACFLRDTYTEKVLKEYTKTYTTLDLAFFIAYEDFIAPLSNKYTVINLDSPEKTELEYALYNQYKDAYIMRNNPTNISIFNVEKAKQYKFFVAENYYSYFRFLKGAEYVITNRVHTVIACIILGIPVKYIRGLQNSGFYQRDLLLELLNIQLQNETEIKPENIDRNLLKSFLEKYILQLKKEYENCSA